MMQGNMEVQRGVAARRHTSLCILLMSIFPISLNRIKHSKHILMLHPIINGRIHIKDISAVRSTDIQKAFDRVCHLFRCSCLQDSSVKSAGDTAVLSDDPFCLLHITVFKVHQALSGGKL